MPILTNSERIGTLIGGKYRLESILGTGGMGVVFEATHNWTGRHVAVKLLHPEYAGERDLVQRFLTEARAAAQLAHPNVVDVLDMGADDDHTVYLVLALLQGESLAHMIERRTSLSEREIAEVLLPITAALDVAHAGGIIHRDIKSENIFVHVDATGRAVPKLLDFGIAKVFQMFGTHIASTGDAIVGTPHYMSPEQAQSVQDIGPGVDVWSLGVVLYEALTGMLPYDTDNPMKVLALVRDGQTVPIRARRPDLSDAIVNVVTTALDVDPARRYTQVRQLGIALARAVGVAHPWQSESAGSTPPPRVVDVVNETRFVTPQLGSPRPFDPLTPKETRVTPTPPTAESVTPLPIVVATPVVVSDSAPAVRTVEVSVVRTIEVSTTRTVESVAATDQNFIDVPPTHSFDATPSSSEVPMVPIRRSSRPRAAELPLPIQEPVQSWHEAMPAANERRSFGPATIMQAAPSHPPRKKREVEAEARKQRNLLLIWSACFLFLALLFIAWPSISSLRGKLRPLPPNSSPTPTAAEPAAPTRAPSAPTPNASTRDELPIGVSIDELAPEVRSKLLTPSGETKTREPAPSERTHVHQGARTTPTEEPSRAPQRDSDDYPTVIREWN